jgi:very-short-patch-repair endonuclease
MRGEDRERAGRARSLRQSGTQAELLFWRRVRNRQLGGFKFVRQEPIDSYYADFVRREGHLIVELDGGQHNESALDRQRDKDLAALGYRVIRIWNNEVLENLDGVLQELFSELENSPSPQPSPRKRGEGASA